MLIDSAVLIDYLRGQDGAAAFLKSLAARSAISVLSIAELYAGLRSAGEEQAMESCLRRLRLFPSQRQSPAAAGISLGDTDLRMGWI